MIESDNNLHNLFGVVAGVISLIAWITYYISIYRGSTIPNRMTWFILTIVGVILASSYFSLGARETIWVSISYIVGPLLVLILSIKRGEGGFGYMDIACLVVAVMSLIIWFMTDKPLVALLMNLAIDFFGILPTVIKSYQRPNSEDKITWFIVSISSLLNLFAINTWSVDISLYPIYMFTLNTLIATLLIFPSFRIKRLPL